MHTVIYYPKRLLWDERPMGSPAGSPKALLGGMDAGNHSRILPLGCRGARLIIDAVFDSCEDGIYCRGSAFSAEHRKPSAIKQEALR